MRQTDALLNKYESLKNRAHNLNLYLDYVRQVDPTLWATMMDEFEGMAGYTQGESTYSVAEE